MRFNPGNRSSSQVTVIRVISRDDVATTGGDSNVSHTTLTSEEDEGTNGRVSIVMSESFGGSLPVNKGSVESTGGTAISHTDEVVAQSSVFRIVAGGQTSFSIGDGLSARSGVGETVRAVSTRRSGGRGVAASGEASSTSRDESTTDVSSLSRNMIPHISSARET